MFDSLLKLWLSQKGFLAPNDHIKRFTHLCMDNGKLYIPGHEMFNFWEQIQIGYDNGERYFICETPNTPIRRFYCDFDFKESVEIDVEFMKSVVKYIHNIINEYFGIVLYTILCISPYKKLDGEYEGKIKSGFHMMWPDLYLNEHTSICLCQILIQELEKFNEEYKWNQIVDLGVYRTGLRMIGMWKMVPNPNKQIKKRIVEKRDYTPVYKYPEDPDYFDGNWFKYLRDCSIQNLFHEIPIPAMTPMRPIVGNDTVSEREILHELTIEDSIRSYIRNFLPKEWDDEITKVEKKNTWYLVRTKSRYCANIKGEHNSENIYFRIYTHGFVQKCFCRCDKLEGRHFGLCKNFVSKKYPLSEKLFKVLFPEKQQKPKEKMPLEKNGNTFLPNRNLTNKNLGSFLKMSFKTLKSIEKKCL